MDDSWWIAPTIHNRPLLTNSDAATTERPTLDIDISVSSPPSGPVPAHNAGGANPGHDERVSSVPNWISLIKPLPPAGESVITLRRDNHFALEIILEHLTREPPEGCDGIKVPATASVKNCANTTDKTLLEFSVRLYGATTNQRYEVVCESCQKREGKRRGIPSLIDFIAEYDVIEPKDGKIRVEFMFCCYPKCHKLGDMEYILEIILSEDEGQNHTVARCRLPFSFNILSKFKGKRPREDEDPSTFGRRRTRRRVRESHVPVQRNSPKDGQAHYTASAISHGDAPRGVQFCESNPSPPTAQTSRLCRHADASSPLRKSTEFLDQATPAPTLTEDPDSGSTTGGARIWLKGIDFPALFPLFARFGNAVVPTTFSSSSLLACHLPPKSTPGITNVTLSKHPRPNAPEYGTSIATFQYKGDHDELITIIMRIQGQAHSPLLQAILTALGNQGNSSLYGGASSYEPVPAQSKHRFGGDFQSIRGSSGGIRPPEELHGEVGRSPTWPFLTDIASPLAHQAQDPYLDATSTPFSNQEFNPSIPPHATAQQYQWNPSNQLPPTDPLLNAFGLGSFCIPGPPCSMDRSPQGRFSGAAGNNLSTVPPVRTQMTQVESAQSLATHEAPVSVHSPHQDNIHGLSLPYGLHFMSSQLETAGNMLESSSQIRRVSEPVDFISTLATDGPAQAILMDDSDSIPSPVGIIPNMSLLDHMTSNTPMDSKPPESIQPISEVPFSGLYGHRVSADWRTDYARLPCPEEATRHSADGVERDTSIQAGVPVCQVIAGPSVPPIYILPPPADPAIGLGLRTRRSDRATSESEVNERRSRKRRSMGRSRSRSRSRSGNQEPPVLSKPMLRRKVERISKEALISWRTEWVGEHVQSLRPRTFRYDPRRPSVDNISDDQLAGGAESPVKIHSPGICRPSSPRLSEACANTSQRSRSQAHIGSPSCRRKEKLALASAFDHRQQVSGRSEMPSAIAEVSSQVGWSPHLAMTRDRDASSKMSQGLQLSSRCDSDESILQGYGSCEDSLSSSPTPSFGSGLPRNADSSSVVFHSNKEVPQMHLTTFNAIWGSGALQGGNRGSNPQEGPIELGLVAALTCLKSQSNFLEIVSTTNDWGQTLAHLSILYGYPILLSHLVDWHINLTVADANGLTALHYAYMKSDLESVRILRRGGAFENVVDKLGRRPSDLQSGEFGSATDIDAKVAFRRNSAVYSPGSSIVEQEKAQHT